MIERKVRSGAKLRSNQMRVWHLDCSVRCQMNNLAKDLTFAVRRFRRKPFQTLAIVLVLALGMAATTTIFTIVNTFLLSPLPYPEPDRLVALWETPLHTESRNLVSYPDFRDWSDDSKACEAMAAFRYATPPFQSGADPEIIRGAIVSAGYFPVLGIAPLMGRQFLPEDCEPGAPRVIVLSYDLWRKLGSHPDALGSSVTVEGRAHTVVGVMPPELKVMKGIEEPRFWIPVDSSGEARFNHRWFVLARLKPGVTIGQARAEMQAIAERLSRAYPGTNAAQTVFVDADTHEEYFVSQVVRLPALALSCAVLFLLLIVCVNVAGLLSAAVLGRSREFAIRSSLGCGRARLVRQILTECLLLACAGGGLAVLFSSWSIYLINAALMRTGFEPGMIRLDAGALAFVFLTCLVVSFAFGSFPALRANRIPIVENLKSASTAISSGCSRHRSFQFMVAVEVALSLVLLINTGLLVKSFAHVLTADLGFRAEHILTTSTFLSEERYSDSDRQALFVDQLTARISRLPGVEGVGAAGRLPLCGPFGATSLQIGAIEPAPGNEPTEYYQITSPDYFTTLGVPLRSGRFLKSTDREESPRVVIVNHALAAKYWPNEEAVGKQVKIFSQWRTVAGVVGDLSQGGPGVPPKPEIFLPYSQNPSKTAYLVIRTSLDPVALERVIREELRRIDPGQPLSPVETIQRVLTDRLAPRRLTLVLMSVFAGIALILTVAGVYGVVANAVQDKRREVGIRLALGARPASLLLRSLGESAIPVAVGVFAGLTLAFGTTRFLASLFSGVSSRDLGVFCLVPALVTLVALAAAYLPIRKTVGVPPSSVLRWE
jgi:putative ABC transport system permease protein